MEYILKTDSLVKYYGREKVLNRLSMSIPQGAIYGLVGKNGAGKTTLIRLICGLQEPSSGGYSLFGVPHNQKGIEKARRRIGAVVETPSVYLNMTAEDNLKVQYRILGLPSFRGIQSILKTVGLENAGRKKAKDFSLGMRQRLGIAIAIAGSPDFLILDEPINGLDPQGIVEIREIILRLNREYGITVLISSHILDELAKLATYFGFMDNGQMVREIRASELEAAFRKCVRLVVSDVKALSRAMEYAGQEYTILSDHEADVFGEISITKLISNLSAMDCEVLSIHQRDESLETYYMGLVGGAENV